MREFFVVVRVWCVPCRVSRVACIGGARVAAAVGWVGPAWSSGITCRFNIDGLFFYPIVQYCIFAQYIHVQV